MMTTSQAKDGDDRQDPVDEAVSEVRMSFGDHLEELRSALIRGLAGFVIITVFTFYFGTDILVIICRPLWAVQLANNMPPAMQALSPTAAFTTYLKISILSGLILSMPWLIYQIWHFVASGLYDHERRFAKRLVVPSVLLFSLGVLFLYFVVLPLVLQFFLSFNQNFGTTNLLPEEFAGVVIEQPEALPAPDELADSTRVPLLQEDPEDPQDGDVWINVARKRLMCKVGDRILSVRLEVGTEKPIMQSLFAIDFYISFVLMLALAFGVAFETPLVVYFLARSGIATTQSMAKARRYVLLGAIFIGAVLTPPDVISQVLLAGPMYLLFEAGLWVARRAERRMASEAA